MNCLPIFETIQKCVKRRPIGELVISASYTGSIVGLNRYENARDIILKHLGKSKVESSLKPNDPRSIGIKYENRAVKLYCRRHRLDYHNGFKPPYIFVENEKNNLYLGGEADFIYQTYDNKNVLLEIKCLVYRKITQKIPFHYWLQVQTMLYVYHLLGIDIDHAIYCENVFSQEGKLTEHWESRIDLELDYFEDKIIPILANYRDIYSKKSSGAQKRGRESDLKAIEPKNFFKRSKKPGTTRLSRICDRKIYSHFMTSPSVFGPTCLYNFIKNNNLRDWYYYREVGKNNINKTPLSKGSKTFQSLEIPKILNLLKPVLKTEDNLIVKNIEKSFFPSHVGLCDKPYHEHFSPIKYNETLSSLKEGDDIIFNAQLYNPSKSYWVNYDVLIKNIHLKDIITPPKEETKEEYTRPFPKHYTPLKIIPYKYNNDNLTSRKARIELMMQLEALNFYFSGYNNHVLVLDSEEKITELDVSKLSNLKRQFENGIEWLNDLTCEKSDLKVDPPNDSRLFPNGKVSTRDLPFEEFKSKLIEKNGELTTMWSISNQKRDKLVSCKYNIKTISDLEKYIDKKKVIEILGHVHQNIKNMLFANRVGKIVELKPVREELKFLKNDYEIFLDFEFTPDFIYVIGVYESKPAPETSLQKIIKKLTNRSCKSRKEETKFVQMVLKDNSEDSQADLLNEFAEYIKRLVREAKSRINCYHWGEVEERLIKRYLPDVFDFIDFIDVHAMILEHCLAIPNCKSYTIKDVAKTLRNMGYIHTKWEENTDGYWCNQALNTLLTKHASPDDTSTPVSLQSCNGFDKILDYNHTDCKVLNDIVKFFRGDDRSSIKED